MWDEMVDLVERFWNRYLVNATDSAKIGHRVIGDVESFRKLRMQIMRKSGMVGWGFADRVADDMDDEGADVRETDVRVDIV